MSELIERIGARVRARRLLLGDTVKRLAERSGLSPRFLFDVEAGKANISISRLASLSDALGMPLTALVRSPTGTLAQQGILDLLAECDDAALARVLDVLEITLGRRRRPIIALLGIRGAGKSSVGTLLAEAMQLPFVELADCIESRSGLSLGDIFTLHGEAFYRELELRCFVTLLESDDPCVVALPGGIVNSEDARTLITSRCTSVFLKAKAEDHWERVFAQGDTRPMAGRTDAMADLRALIQRRAPLYAQADLTVNTSDVMAQDVVDTILNGLNGLG